MDKHRLLIVLAKAITIGDTIKVDPGGTDIHGGLVAITGMSAPDRVDVTKDSKEFFLISLAKPAPNFSASLHVHCTDSVSRAEQLLA